MKEFSLYRKRIIPDECILLKNDHIVSFENNRLVTTWLVEIKKLSEDELSGSAPEITRYFIELRGIGIIDAKMLFGVGSWKSNQVKKTELLF